MSVVFLPRAEHDLSDLFLYIHDELQNPSAAHNVATKILARSQSLEAFPTMGASLASIDQRLGDYRYLLVDNYLIIYRSSTEQISIVRILYARSDYVQLLQG
ncbi:MAG: type II toxin-antitoxin system RelE/ParE family toxin [Candidatus Saccharibacteria bacterium]